jgi:hypothetical protein
MNVKQFFPRLKTVRYNWLFTASLIIIVYLVIDGFTFLLNPYSGRISTFACKTDAETGTLCTVTIYGLREIYRKSFTPDEFFRAVVIKNYPGDSWDTTYGLTIQTKTENINYLYHIHPPAKPARVAHQINDLFVDGHVVPDTFIITNGLDASIYRRGFLILLVIGLAWLAARLEVTRFKGDLPIQLYSSKLWPFMRYWIGVDVIARLGFYLTTPFIIGCSVYRYSNAMYDFCTGCRGVFIREPGLTQFPWAHLLCVYPLVLILVMQSLLQRQLLARANIKLSAWWVTAPLLASVVLPLLSPSLTCDDCVTLKYLMAGFVADYESSVLITLLVYFLLVGLLQFIVCRKKIPCSILWIIMPPVNALFVSLPWLVSDTYYRHMTATILVVMILLALIVSIALPALTISWLVNRMARRSSGCVEQTP